VRDEREGAVVEAASVDSRRKVSVPRPARPIHFGHLEVEDRNASAEEGCILNLPSSEGREDDGRRKLTGSISTIARTDGDAFPGVGSSLGLEGIGSRRRVRQLPRRS